MTTTHPETFKEPLLPPSDEAKGEVVRQKSFFDEEVVKTEEAEPESTSRGLLAAFFCLGAGSGVLWSALMLCVGTLAEAYGTTVMSTMSSVQNNSWLWSMVFFTIIPRPASHKVTLALLMIAILGMLALAFVLARTLSIGASALPAENYFLIAIAANGICTGTVQILAASLSGLFSVVNSSVPSTLLLGVTAGPLLLAALSLLLPAVGADPSLISFVTMSAAAVFLGLAMLGLARLSREQPPPPVITIGSCRSDGGKNKEYLWKRVGEMVANSGLLLMILLFGMLTLASVPYGAPHVCGEDAHCTANLPRVMVAMCTVSNFIGRFLATLRGAERSIRSIGVSVVLRACFAGTFAYSYSRGHFPEGVSGQVAAVAGIVIVTIWGNGLTIDLNRESQRACGHSLILPCPITAQISWISLQSGSLFGSLLSFFFK